MPNTRRDEHKQRAFAGPLVWIAALMAAYFILADWQALPRLITATFASIG